MQRHNPRWGWGAALLASTALLAVLVVGPPRSAAQGLVTLLVPVSQWAEDFDAERDVAYGVAVDFSDNAIVVGTSRVIAYSPGGTRLWWAAYPGVAFDVVTDTLGDAIVAGDGGLVKYASGGRTLWRVPGRFGSVAVAFEDAIVAAGEAGVALVDPSGRKVERLDPGLDYAGRVRAVAVDPTGKLLVVAGEAGIVQYDLERRQRLWRVAYPGEARDVAVDSEGAIVVVGSLGVSKYGPGGVLLWREVFPGEPQAVAVLPLSPEQRLQLGTIGDFVFVTGGNRAGGDWDYLTVKYAPTGKLVWEARYDGRVGDDVAYGIAVSRTGYLYVAGTSTLAKGPFDREAAQQDGRAGDPTPDPAPDPDYYTIQYLERPLSELVEEGRCPDRAGSPLADFAVEPPLPVAGELVAFYDRSVDPDGHILTWAWDFGDGTTAQGPNPTHAYARPGTYTVTLIVVDNAYCVGRAQRALEVIAVAPPVTGGLSFSWQAEAAPVAGDPVADFAWTVEREVHGGYPPGFLPAEATDLDVVHFEDRSTIEAAPAEGPVTVRFSPEVDPELEAQVVGWLWDFGDGTTSTERAPTHVYAAPGSYLVGLTAILLDGTTLRHEELIDARPEGAAVGRIVSWLWDFGDGDVSTEQNPGHHYLDDGLYTVTLTVTDDRGRTSTAQKAVLVLNVPPVADFDALFEGWSGSCAELGLPITDVGFGTACGAPTAPPNTGALDLIDQSYDSESWFPIVSWSWTFAALDGGVIVCDGGAGCETLPDPRVVAYTDGTGDFLYRGPLEVTLLVADDDGATAQATQTLEVANIPPYAVFDWSTEGGGLSETACDSCASLYGTGTPSASASLGGGAVTITRDVSTECGDLNASQAICGIWNAVNFGIYVELTIGGSGVVELTETAPTGWVFDSCWDGGSNLVTCDGTQSQLSATIDLDALGGSYFLSYALFPPPTAAAGAYTIAGAFVLTLSGESVDLDSTVVLCDRVNAEGYVEFWGYDDFDAQDLLGLPGIDPNGDAILSYDWDFGSLGTATGQTPHNGTTCEDGACTFWLEDLVCVYDDTFLDWFWSYDLDVTLTMTDEAGGSTDASATIPLTGRCAGGGGI